MRIGTPIGQDITRRIIFLLELSVDDARILLVSSLEKGRVVARYQLHRELELPQLDLGTAVVPRPDLRPVHGHAHHVPRLERLDRAKEVALVLDRYVLDRDDYVADLDDPPLGPPEPAKTGIGRGRARLDLQYRYALGYAQRPTRLFLLL